MEKSTKRIAHLRRSGNYVDVVLRKITTRCNNSCDENTSVIAEFSNLSLSQLLIRPGVARSVWTPL